MVSVLQTRIYAGNRLHRPGAVASNVESPMQFLGMRDEIHRRECVLSHTDFNMNDCTYFVYILLICHYSRVFIYLWLMCHIRRWDRGMLAYVAWIAIRWKNYTLVLLRFNQANTCNITYNTRTSVTLRTTLEHRSHKDKASQKLLRIFTCSPCWVITLKYAKCLLHHEYLLIMYSVGQHDDGMTFGHTS